MGKIAEQIKSAKIYIGNSNDMCEIPSGSVNLIITSPPYWTLKDYDVDGQIGLGSNSYENYIEELKKSVLQISIDVSF